MRKKYSVFLGRWQPLHNGHLWLINQELEKNKPILILVRDILPDARNPFTTEETVEMIETTFVGQDVKVMVIPDVDSFHFGRGVGYDVVEHIPPDEIKCISATEIRNKIENEDETWKSLVQPKTVEWLENYFKDK